MKDNFQIYQVSRDSYNLLTKQLKSAIFHRVTSSGDYLIKPLKVVKHLVEAHQINKLNFNIY